MAFLQTNISGIQHLPLRQQVEMINRAFKSNPASQAKQAEILKKTWGCLDEADGKAFEEAMNTSRRIEST